MPDYQRKHVQVLATRLNETVTRIIVVTGPRQTGKTTLVKQTLRSLKIPGDSNYLLVGEPSAPTPYEDIDDSRDSFSKEPVQHDSAWLIDQWERARSEAETSHSGYVLVLDEIQKIPNWSEVVKGLWDSDRSNGIPLHIVLLGSAPLLMQQGLTESLAGRFEIIPVTHWSFLEMHDAFEFDLPTYLFFGGYPGCVNLINDHTRWVNYMITSLIEPNIKKDILMMTRVDKPALLQQLFELGCQYSGQELSFNKMKGQLQNAGNETTLAHYLNLLESAGLLVGLQKYANQHVRRRASSPKLIALNTGLMAALSGYTFEQAQADRTFWGRLVESAVGAHLYNVGHSDYKLYYWRDGHDEIDFVIEKGKKVVGIEVKSSPAKQSRDGLELFKKRFKTHNTILVGETGEPLERFLVSNSDDWFK